MKTAKEIICALPDWCYGVLPVDKSLIIIKAGESGYWPANHHIPQPAKIKTADQIADELNAQRKITKAQRKAMEYGSMFGWGTGGADPDNYNENGNPIKTKS